MSRHPFGKEPSLLLEQPVLHHQSYLRSPPQGTALQNTWVSLWELKCTLKKGCSTALTMEFLSPIPFKCTKTIILEVNRNYFNTLCSPVSPPPQKTFKEIKLLLDEREHCQGAAHVYI